MKKLLKITGSTLLFLLLIMVGLYFLALSPIGSSILKPYVKEGLEEKIGMPVEIEALDLGFSTASLVFSINKQAQVIMELSQYDLSNDRYEGTYHVKTDQFTYKNKKLNRADLNGSFKYIPEDVYVDGEGNALDAQVDYRFNIVDNLPQQILLNIKEAQLSEVLQLAGQPDIAEGKIDVKINIPDMAGDREQIYGYVDLKKSYFKPQRVKELYDYELPEKSYLHGRVDGNLEGENVKFVGGLQSNLFVLQVKEALVSMFTEDWNAVYNLDVKDMRILSKNKLAGALDLKGKVKGKSKEAWVTAKSNSLNGDLQFYVYQGVEVTIEKVALEKVLTLLKQPDYATGELKGFVKLYWFPHDPAKVGKVLTWHKWTAFSHDLKIDKGVLTPKAIEKMSQYNIPLNNSFSLETKGKIAKGAVKKLTGNAKMHATFADVTLSSIEYDFHKKVLTSKYDLSVHDTNTLLPKAKVKKGTPLLSQGSLTFKDKLTVSGNIKGLGKKVAFTHDGIGLKIDASGLYSEKIFALFGLPAYAKGTMDTQVDLLNHKPREGTFTINNATLVTQPKEMKKWMGEPLKEKVTLNAAGTFKKGKGYGDAEVKTSIGDIYLKKMFYDSDTKAFKTNYMLDIPDLKKWHKVIDQKLYGPLKLIGLWNKEKLRTVTGEITTLGGKVSYRLSGDDLNTQIENVPLDNILALLGHKKNFLGKAYGKGKYHLKRKSGIVDIDIKDFKIKPSPTTNTIKLIIGKDPTRVIFDSTKFHADIKGKITEYSLHAVGTRSSIDITDGRVDKIKNTNTAKFTFVYEKYTVHGKIKGSIENPKVTVDTSAILKDKIDEELQDQIEKALGGKAGDILRNLKF